MASQTNHNASYLYEVDGITVWERLRVIRNFLEDRKLAYELAIIDREESEYKLSKLDDSKESEFERRRLKAHEAVSADALLKCKEEIEFLVGLERDILAQAEKTRIADKTDSEMYELNFYKEITARNVRKAHADLISTGRLSHHTLDALFRCPPAMDILNAQGIINSDQIYGLIDGSRKDLTYYDTPQVS